jgi:hypothetical protein
MIRLDLNASGESPRSAEEKLEILVTVIAPDNQRGAISGGDRRIANTRDGKPVWIRPRRGVREGAPAARPVLYRARAFAQNPGELVPRRDDLDRDVGVFVGVIAGAHPVVAVSDLQRHVSGQISADNQNR